MYNNTLHRCKAHNHPNRGFAGGQCRRLIPMSDTYCKTHANRNARDELRKARRGGLDENTYQQCTGTTKDGRPCQLHLWVKKGTEPRCVWHAENIYYE